jgi:hypothetical protein
MKRLKHTSPDYSSSSALTGTPMSTPRAHSIDRAIRVIALHHYGRVPTTRAFGCASPRSQIISALGFGCNPDGIQTRVYGPPRAFVLVPQSWAMLTKRRNGRG